MSVEYGGSDYGAVENAVWSVLGQIAASGDSQGQVPIKIPSFTLGDHYGGYKAAVADTYAVDTNRIVLAAACKHIVIYTGADMYLVMDSADPTTDLADGATRIFIPANTYWERSFSATVTNLDFKTTTASVTGAVHVEAYT